MAWCDAPTQKKIQYPGAVKWASPFPVADSSETTPRAWPQNFSATREKDSVKDSAEDLRQEMCRSSSTGFLSEPVDPGYTASRSEGSIGQMPACVKEQKSGQSSRIRWIAENRTTRKRNTLFLETGRKRNFRFPIPYLSSFQEVINR